MGGKTYLENKWVRKSLNYTQCEDAHKFWVACIRCLESWLEVKGIEGNGLNDYVMEAKCKMIDFGKQKGINSISRGQLHSFAQFIESRD